MAKNIKSLGDVFSSHTSRRYKRGHIIFHQGDELAQVGYILKGYVKLYNITNDGEERILLLMGPGMPVPFSLSFKKGYLIKYFYEAFTDCKLRIVPREKVETALNASKTVKLLMAHKLEELMIDLSERIAIFENKNAVDKVTRLLPYLVKNCGEQITNDVYAIKFKITHQDIANMTGLARETASIQLKRLEKEGILTQKRSFTVIDMSKLPPE